MTRRIKKLGAADHDAGRCRGYTCSMVARTHKPPGHWPREHGAVAQLLIPLAAALLLGHPNPSALLLAVAALATFAAHEPLLVLRGLRGKRVQVQEGALARRHLLQRLAVATLAGFWPLLHASRAVWGARLVLALLATAQLALTLTGRHKSLPGEWLAGGLLSMGALPVALTAGVTLPDAWVQCATWASGFALMTTAVHACKARALQQGTYARLAIATLVPGLLAIAGALLRPQWRAVLPMAGAAILLTLVPVRPRHMARVGWLLAVASLLGLALQLTARAGGL